MRLADEENFLRRSRLDELLQHLAAVMLRVTDLAPQLAVRERTGAAFAKLHIRFRIKHASTPQAPGVLGPLAHRLAAFKNDRTKTHLRQQQPGEQAAGAGADNDRARGQPGRGVGDEFVGGVGRRAEIGVVLRRLQSFRHGSFIFQRNIQREDKEDIRALAGIVAAAKNRDVEQFVGRNAQAFNHCGFKGGVVVVERELDLSQAQHGVYP